MACRCAGAVWARENLDQHRGRASHEHRWSTQGSNGTHRAVRALLIIAEGLNAADHVGSDHPRDELTNRPRAPPTLGSTDIMFGRPVAQRLAPPGNPICASVRIRLRAAGRV